MTPSFKYLSRKCFLKFFIVGSIAAASNLGSLLVHSEFITTKAHASSTGKSGLPLPRFVSLKAKRVNMRVGPGRQFQVIWRYLRPGLPMEIIQEYENWRKVRDPEGNEGWILHSLLSSKRTAIVKPWETDKISGLANLHSKESKNTQTLAKLEPWVLAKVEACDANWCRINVQDVKGYISKSEIWGVYPDEKIEE